MSRALTNSAVQALMAQETGAVFLLLLTIEHDTLSTPIRLVNNTQNVTYGALEYQAFSFDVTLPADDSDTLPVAKLTLDNVGQEVIETIRTITSEPIVTLEIGLIGSGTTIASIEMAIYDMTLKSVQYDQYTISGDLVVEDILNQPLHGSLVDSSQYRGLF